VHDGPFDDALEPDRLDGFVVAGQRDVLGQVGLEQFFQFLYVAAAGLDQIDLGLELKRRQQQMLGSQELALAALGLLEGEIKNGLKFGRNSHRGSTVHFNGKSLSRANFSV